MKEQISFKQWNLERSKENERTYKSGEPFGGIASVAQVRMISSGNHLIGRSAFSSPEYGIFFVENFEEDPLTPQRYAGVYSAIGGGATAQAPIEFFVRKAPFPGFFVRRRHDYNHKTDKIIGYSPTLLGADGVAYRKAMKTAERLPFYPDGRSFYLVQDKTSEDLAQYAECPILELEKRVYDWQNRVKQQSK